MTERTRTDLGEGAFLELYARLVTEHERVMERIVGTVQTRYRHALPKTRRPASARLNLTFRHVRP